MIEDLRRRGWQHAYVIGYTVKQEGIHGLDVSIQVPPSTRLLSLQFKKPISRGPSFYTFILNNNKARDQHLRLLATGLMLAMIGKGHAIFYALAPICDLAELQRSMPYLLEVTLFINVLDLPFLGFRSCRLRVDVRRYSSYSPLTITNAYFSCSSWREVKVYTWESILTNIREWTVTEEDLRKIKRISHYELEDKLITYLEKYMKRSEIEKIITYFRTRRAIQRIRAIALMGETAENYLHAP